MGMHDELVRLLDDHPDWVNMRDPDHGYTALHYVVKMGPENTDPNPEKVLYLLLLTSIYMMCIHSHTAPLQKSPCVTYTHPSPSLPPLCATPF